MMVKGLSGQQYQLETKPFRSGGEGEVFYVLGDATKVVKLYHADRITKELEQKLQTMAKKPPSASILSQVAWPLDVLYDLSNRFCGFVMPKLSITAELSEIYVYPPKTNITYKQKLILAQNICVVIAEVHKAGYIFGDFNPRNIGINTNTGTVAFLDTDSYHIVVDKNANKAYRCNVCAPGYAAPELLEKCRAHIVVHPEDSKQAYAKTPLDTFTKETDNFALAIHMFKLLMNGYTPFGGIKETESASVGSPGVGDEAVRRDSYCFKKGNKPQAVAVPPLESLPKEISELFTRAFVYGKKEPKQRPSALEWHRELENFESVLQVCHESPTHMYSSNISSCPWCQADKRYVASIAPRMTQRSFTTPVIPNTSSTLSGNLGYTNVGTTGNYTQTKSVSTLKSKLDKRWVGGIVIVMIFFLLISSYLSTNGTNNFPFSIIKHDLGVQNPQDNKSNYTFFTIPSIEEKNISIHPLSQTVVSIENAIILSYSGMMTYDAQEASYVLEAPYDGQYRVDINGLTNGAEVELHIYDDFGNVIASDTRCINGEGITLKDVIAGNRYKVKVVQESGYSAYVLEIGLQKSAIDISNLTGFTDSVEFKDQRNVYNLTVPIDGTYRFEISEMMNETMIELYVLNEQKEIVEANAYCENNEGITVRDMRAGEMYEVQVRQDLGFSSYVLSIGTQKEIVDISELTVVTDSVEFKDQRNIYNFTAPMDGIYRFELFGITNGTNTELYIFNKLKETIVADTYCISGEGVTVEDMKAGETYEIQVRQDTGFSNYTLSIGHQKETVDIQNHSIISDSIEYAHQMNRYFFCASMSGNATFTISGMEKGMAVEVYVWNDLGEVVASDTYCQNGESITVKNVFLGTKYEVQVKQRNGVGKYELIVD